MSNFEQQIRNEQFKQATGSAPNFRAIDGVGDKTARAVKNVIGINAPTDAADKTADELAEEAGISENRARKVIRGGGGNPDRKPRSKTGSVEAGGLADAMEDNRQQAGQVVEQRRDVFGNVVKAAEEIPDRRQRRRGDFGAFEDRDPKEVREIGRAATTLRDATQDPIDVTKEQQTFGFDEEDREAAGRVSVAAREYLQEQQDIDFDEAGRRIETERPDINTVESVTSSLVSPRGSLRGPTSPTDIGRQSDGEYARPEKAPDITPAPVARNRESGRFGLDPFDLTSGGVGDSVELFGGGSNEAMSGGREPREIEYGGEQVDLTQQDTEDLKSMNDFFKQNINAEVDAERARGGFGTSDFAQEMSSRQVEVATELDERRRR